MKVLMLPDRSVMGRAILLAKDNHFHGGSPIAAIIVKDTGIVSEAVTTIVRDKDATCHAEINAIRAASKKLDTLFLKDCYMYTTYEPCPMCTSAAIWAKMKGVVYGASRHDQTPQQLWRVNIASAEIIRHGSPTIELYEEFMREECRELLYLT